MKSILETKEWLGLDNMYMDSDLCVANFFEDTNK